MFTPYGRTKDLLNKIQALEDKLMNTGFLPLSEQNLIHAEIQRHKKELVQLEKQTRR